MRKRPDLSARQQRYQGRLYWIVKDPVGLNYFRFQEEEYAILLMLDGNTSLDEIKARFEDEFPPQKITVEELQQFIGTLHRSGLIIADAPGQGHQLHKRRDERKHKELLQALTNILAIRFKGIDPDRLLNWMHPKLYWIYSRWCVVLCLLFALSALTLVMVQYDEFQSKLPTFHQFFNLRNAMWLAIAMGVTKVIHEFGHGLTCKHFGGECHEMGVMILVLTPCLYCNVSDSWMLPNKWHRAWIGAAGMYVEVVIASFCTYIWWYSSEHSMINQLALSTMFVCSVSTVIFNGNPLLRYDGYYILADILEIPNLRQKASSILNRKLGWLCLGLEPQEDPFLPQRNQAVFAVYSIAAVIYRWIVTFSIIWFLYQFWKPYRLEVIGEVILAMSLYGLAVQPLWNFGKFLSVPGRIDKVKRPRLLATLGVVAAVFLAIAYVPLPYRVLCTLEIKPDGAEPVYVDVPGRLETMAVKQNDQVQAGQLIARLANVDLAVDIEDLTGQIAQQEHKIESLGTLAFGDPLAREQLAAERAMLASLQEQLAQKQTEHDRLNIVAPVAGTVLPPPEQPKPPEDSPQLPTWFGTLLEPRNLGAFVKETDLVCHVGDPRRLTASLVIDQTEINFIEPGQDVEILLKELPDQILWGKVKHIAPSELRFSPRQLSNKAGGELATVTDETGMERPLSTSYEARVPIEDKDGLLRLGLTGTGKIHAGWQSLGRRFWRYITQTFRFKL